MENPTSVFDQPLFAQLAPSETLGQSYVFESGWSDCEWQATLPDCFSWTQVARQNFVELIVNDNGRGIDVLSQSKIFDTFVTIKPAGKGTGIGLSISDSIVLEHGVLSCRAGAGHGRALEPRQQAVSFA